MSTPADTLSFLNLATVLNTYLGLCLFSSKIDDIYHQSTYLHLNPLVV